MKRLLILTLALATMLALAAPVGAAKPARLELGVTIESNLWWANAPGDTIVYTIEVETAPGYETWTIETDYGWLEPNECAESPCVLTYEVVGNDLFLDAILNTVTVTFEGEGGEKIIKSATDTVSMFEIGPCEFVQDAVDQTKYVREAYDGGTCIFDLGAGSWTIESKPDYDFAGRNPTITMRDHVPGNWCMVGETETEGGSKTRPTTVTRYVDLPTSNPFGFGDWFEVGVCGLGGHGACTDEGCFLPTGNPVNFVLAAPPGTVTATRLGDAPLNP